MKLQIDKKIFNQAYLKYLLDYSKRYEVYYGGAGSGKSKFLAQKLVYKSLTDRRKVLILRKVGRTSKNSTFSIIKDTLSDWKLLDYCKINNTDLSIVLPNGSTFIFMGLDDQEKLKSITGLTDAWLEEATEFNQDDFNQVDLRIRSLVSNLQIFLSFNPVSKANWCYLLFFKPDNQDVVEFRKKCLIVQTTYKDNKFLPHEYVDSLLMLKYTNPVFFKIYAEGEFGSLDKLVYNNWQKQDFDKNDLKNLPLLVGLDFGYTNDPTALVASLIDQEHNRIYIFDEFVQTGLVNTDIADMIEKKGYSKSVIIADSAEQKSIEELRRAGVTRIKASVKGPDSILAGIQKVQQYELIVHPSCCHVLEELENYTWQKDKATNEYINKPVDRFNHCLDALRYSTQCIAVNPKLKTMSKSSLF